MYFFCVLTGEKNKIETLLPIEWLDWTQCQGEKNKSETQLRVEGLAWIQLQGFKSIFVGVFYVFFVY